MSSERLITLAEAMPLFQAYGLPVESPKKLIRYCHHGIRINGRVVRLRALKWLGQWRTSPKDVEEFIARLSPDHIDDQCLPLPAEEPRQPTRKQRVAAAMVEAASKGL